MTTFEQFLVTRQKRIEDRLAELIPSADTEPKKLHESVRYTLFADAKRIRPIFLLAVAKVFRVPEEDLVNAACSLEMVHTSSLILDDLPCMDAAVLRRGKTANHLVFGQDTAILAAMYLLDRAFGVLAHYRSSFFSPHLAAALVEILSNAVGPSGLIGGQMVDLASKGKKIDLETLEFIHSRKTGALFYAAAEMAATFARARDTEKQAVLTFARNLGLAFQISDDILDATSSTERIGKDTGKDVDKTTFITFCGLQGAQSLAGELIDTAVESLKPLKSRGDLLRDFAAYVRYRTK